MSIRYVNSSGYSLLKLWPVNTLGFVHASASGAGFDFRGILPHPFASAARVRVA